MGFRAETSRFRISYLTGGLRANAIRLLEDGLCVRIQHFHIKDFEEPSMTSRRGGLFCMRREGP